MSRVLGLDLSLSNTGLAGTALDLDGSQLGWTEPIKPPAGLRGPERLLWFRQCIGTGYLSSLDLAVIEGPSYGNQGQGRQSGHHERAGLWWAIRTLLHTRGVPTAVVAPATLKRYATGKGNAGKTDVVLAAARRFPWFAGGDDEADALVLAAMGADRLGTPLTEMPKTHRAALDAVDWPAVPEPALTP